MNPMKEAWTLLKSIVDNTKLDIEEEQQKWQKQRDEQNAEEDRQFAERWYFPRGSVDQHCKFCHYNQWECECTDPIQEEDLEPLEPVGGQ